MEKKYGAWRWTTGGVLLVGILSQNLLWNAPAPVLTVLLSDLSIDLARGGMLTSIICLVLGLSSLLFDRLGGRVTATRLFLAGLALMAGGQMLLRVTVGYPDLLFCRALTGVGMGLCAPVYAVVVMENFPERERPLMNTLYAALPYAASFLGLSVCVPLLRACGGSWRAMMLVYGAFVAGVALLWALAMPKVRCPRLRESREGRQKGLLREVVKNRECRLLCLADMCDMWGYNCLSAFLPAYFQMDAGMSMERAAALTAIFPVAGIAAGLGCGALMTRVGLRKPFTWPMHLMIFAGTLLLVLGEGPVRILGIVLAGFGNAGWAPALYTMPMEFEGMTALRAGAVFAFMLAMGFLSAFVSPLVGGWLGERLSLRATLLLNAAAALLAALFTFLMKETGPARKRPADGGGVRYRAGN